MRTFLLLASIFTTLALASSCRAPHSGTLGPASGGCTPTTGSASAPVPSASSVALPASSSAPLAFEPERGCAGDLDPGNPPDLQLEQMGASCAHGATRIPSLELKDSDQGEQLTLRLEAYACVRLGIASGVRGSGVEATLTGPDGAELARVVGRTPLMLGRDGPVCVRDAGEYRLSLAALGPTGQLRAAAWVAGP